MLDIKLIRKSPEAVRAALKSRGGRSLPDLERLIALDGQLRVLSQDVETLRGRRNTAADEIATLVAENNNEKEES